MTPQPSSSTELPATWPAVLREAGSVLGIDLSPDDSGYLALVVDAQCTLQLQCTEDGRQATLFAAIGQLQADELVRIAPQLLAANFFWQATGGATLGRDPATGQLVLARALAIEPFLAQGSAQAAHQCAAELQAFADRALAWQTQLPEWLEGGEPVTTASPDSTAANPAAGLFFDRA